MKEQNDSNGQSVGAGFPVITRAIPEIVKRRGMAAIRDWLRTDQPWIELWGLEYLGMRRDKRGHPNAAGFWAKRGTCGRYFRVLATLPPMNEYKGKL